MATRWVEHENFTHDSQPSKYLTKDIHIVTAGKSSQMLLSIQEQEKNQKWLYWDLVWKSSENLINCSFLEMT